MPRECDHPVATAVDIRKNVKIVGVAFGIPKYERMAEAYPGSPGSVSTEGEGEAGPRKGGFPMLEESMVSISRAMTGADWEGRIDFSSMANW